MNPDPDEPGTSMLPGPSMLMVGRVGRPHGVRGEVYVDLVTDRTERLAAGARLHTRDGWLTVARSRPVGDRWLVDFEGVTDRDAAARFTGAELGAPPLAGTPDPDALWVHELIGSRVVDRDGVDRGRCTSVIQNPAADLLELSDGALVPVTFVVSCAAGVVIVDVPDGLFELTSGAG